MHNVTTAKQIFRGAIVLALLSLGACKSFSNPGKYALRPVTAKEGISVLVSTGARCLVPTREFPKINVGQQYQCDWRDTPSISSTSAQRPAVAK